MYLFLGLLLCLMQVNCQTRAVGSLKLDRMDLLEYRMLKYQYINRNQEPVIDASKFLSARPFSGGLAAVMAKDGLWGFIDKSGHLVIDPVYEEVNDFSEGLAAVKLPNRSPNDDRTGWAFIDKVGRRVFQTNFEIVYNFSEKVALAQDDAAVYLITVDGKTQKLFSTKELHLGPEINPGFKEGFLVVRDVRTKKYGFINKNVEMVIPPQFEDAASFSENVARVTVDNGGREMLGFLEKDGKFLLSPRFDVDFDYLRNSRDFSDGLAGIAPLLPTTTDLPFYVFIDKAGKIVFSTSSIDVGNFRDGLAFYYDSEVGKYGYVDMSGNIIISPRFERAMDFSEGVACIAIGN